MRKAINLTVKLYVEGDAPPASDFAKTSMQAIRDIISAGHLRHPALAVTVKNIVENVNEGEGEVKPGSDAPAAAPSSTSETPAPDPKKG